MIGRSSNGSDDGDRRRLEWPMADRHVRLCPETADDVGPVSDAY